MAYLTGTTGDDTIFGTSSADYIDGGPYNGLGKDYLWGGGGDDTIYGGLEADVLSGGAGDDTFLTKGVDGWDHYNGGDGYDVIAMDVINQYAYYGLIQIDSMTGIERIENNVSYKDLKVQIRGTGDFSDVELIAARTHWSQLMPPLCCLRALLSLRSMPTTSPSFEQANGIMSGATESRRFML